MALAGGLAAGKEFVRQRIGARRMHPPEGRQRAPGLPL